MLLVQGRGEMALLPAVTAVLLHPLITIYLVGYIRKSMQFESQIASTRQTLISRAIIIKQKNSWFLSYYKSMIYTDDSIHNRLHKGTRNS